MSGHATETRHGPRRTGACVRLRSTCSRRQPAPRPPRAIPRNLADAWFARGAPGPWGAYGGGATNGWRVCGPRPRSSPSKGRTEGDTRLVVVISTRIGCGVGDATAHVGSRRRGEGGPAMICTVAPLPSVAGEQRGPGCRCPDGRRTGLAVINETTQGNCLWPERAHQRWTRWSCNADGGRPPIGHKLENFAVECCCLSANIRHSLSICDI